MFIGPFTTYYLCFTTIFCFLTQLRNLINPITNQKTLRVYILRQYDPNSKKYIVTNLHAVLSSDCARSILQLYYKINTVKKKNTCSIKNLSTKRLSRNRKTHESFRSAQSIMYLMNFCTIYRNIRKTKHSRNLGCH